MVLAFSLLLRGKLGEYLLQHGHLALGHHLPGLKIYSGLKGLSNESLIKICYRTFLAAYRDSPTNRSLKYSTERNSLCDRYSSMNHLLKFSAERNILSTLKVQSNESLTKI